MAVTGAARKDQNLNLSDDDTEALFASPLRPERPKDGKSMPEHHHTEHQSRKVEDREISGKEAREAALRKELAGIRNINQVIEGAIDGLERAGENMDTVSRTVTDASALLNTWTRILSQTEHNQRLILDPSWRGASQDVADMENESMRKQQEKERRELEETQRREARARRAEEQERGNAEAVGAKTPRGGRGRGRAMGRGGIAGRLPGQASTTAPAKDASSKAARAGSSSGRGPSGYRGRSREA